MPLTDQGYTPYTISELRTILRNKYQTLTGETPAWDEDDFLGSFSEAVLSVAVLTGQGVQALYDAFKLDNAQGRFLENLCELAGIERQAATKSRVTLTLTGTNGTVIPTGKRVEGTSNNETWILIEDATISGGTATAEAESENTGPIAGPAATITRIKTPVTGWDTVTNAADATLGTARETDGELRIRYKRDLQSSSTATIPAITSAMEELDFVTRAVVISNGGETDITVGSYTIPAHDILVLLDLTGVLTAAEETELAETFLNTLAGTTNTVGGNTVSTTYRGTTFAYNYADPTDVSITVVATLTVDTGYVLGDVAAEAEAQVQAYIDGLSIGDDVTILGIYGVLNNIDGLVAATFTLNGGSVDITIDQTETAAYDEGGSSFS